MFRCKDLRRGEDELVSLAEFALEIAEQQRECFEDPDFGPCDTEANPIACEFREKLQERNLERETRETIDDELNWERAPDSSNLFSQNAVLSSVIQGRLADRWLLSALAALKSHPSALGRVFCQDILDERLRSALKFRGIYCVRLRFELHWYFMILDQRFPYPLPPKDGGPSSSRRLLFGSNEDVGELWVALAEKAFAKRYGGYDRLERGSIQSALWSLSGQSIRSFPLGTAWHSEAEIDAMRREHGDADRLWESLATNSKGNIVVCTTIPDTLKHLQEKHDETIARLRDQLDSKLKTVHAETNSARRRTPEFRTKMEQLRQEKSVALNQLQKKLASEMERAQESSEISLRH